MGEGLAPPEFVGRTVGGYRFLKPIGRGGMGEVYCAWDERLRRSVAVKVLSTHRLGNELARRRFLRETRLACRVAHPYVAVVHDVVEHEDRVFLVMELIEGRRLDVAVAEDQPGPAELARVGLEITEALEAIHAAGLVHRDLKPGNIMLTTGGHVKVMDFSVAVPVRSPGGEGEPSTIDTADATLTPHGFGVGTVAYMSPEQVRGEDVDARSDLFSLGIVLYEAVTGEHPFQRRSPGETAAAILHEAAGTGPEPESLTHAGPLRGVVLRLLEKDPDRRYQNTAEVLADLRAAAQGTQAASRTSRATWLTTRRAVSALLLVLVAAVATAWFLRPPPPPPPGEVRPVIAILPFDDRTGDPPDSIRGEMVADLLSAGLGGSSLVRPMGTERVAALLGDAPDPATARRRAGAAGAQWTVSGVLHREKESYHAAVEVYQAGGLDPVAVFRVAAAQMSSLVDEAAPLLLSRLFPETDRQAGARASRLTSSSEEALQAYEKARRARRNYRYSEATAALEHSVKVDPSFLAAWIALAEVRNAGGFGKLAADAVDRARRLAEVPGGPPSEDLGLETRATLALVHGDVAGELELRRTLAERRPDDPDRVLRLASCLLANSRYDDALAALDRAATLDPTDPRIAARRVNVLVAARRTKEAAGALEAAVGALRAIPGGSGRPEAESLRGDVAFVQGDLEAAGKFYAAAVEGHGNLGGPIGSAVTSLAAIDVLTGRGVQGLLRLAQLEDEARGRGDLRTMVNAGMLQGLIQYQAGHLAQAESFLSSVVSQARSVQNPRLLLDPLANLASVVVANGRLAEGQALAEEALRLSREMKRGSTEATVLAILADARLQAGEVDAAGQAWADLVELQRSPSRTGEQVDIALRGLSEVRGIQGRPGDARAAALDAVKTSTAGGRAVDAAYAQYYLGQAECALGEWTPARTALDAARHEGEARKLQDLVLRVRAEQARIDLRQGRAREAREALAQVASDASSVDTLALEVPCLTSASQAALAEGDVEGATRTARRALEHRRALPYERVPARVALAAALARAGQADEAEREARRALDEADRMGLRLDAAAAAAVLAGLDPPVFDAAQIRQRGITAWTSFLEGVPPENVASVRSRADLEPILAALRPEETAGTP